MIPIGSLHSVVNRLKTCWWIKPKAPSNKLDVNMKNRSIAEEYEAFCPHLENAGKIFNCETHHPGQDWCMRNHMCVLCHIPLGQSSWHWGVYANTVTHNSFCQWGIDHVLNRVLICRETNSVCNSEWFGRIGPKIQSPRLQNHVRIWLDESHAHPSKFPVSFCHEMPHQLNKKRGEQTNNTGQYFSVQWKLLLRL